MNAPHAARDDALIYVNCTFTNLRQNVPIARQFRQSDFRKPAILAGN